MSRKTWEEMTRQERVALLLEDQQAYMDLVPDGHWLLLLDGVAKLPSVKSRTDESNATQ